jgi:hypothetical protein
MHPNRRQQSSSEMSGIERNPKKVNKTGKSTQNSKGINEHFHSPVNTKNDLSTVFLQQ